MTREPIHISGATNDREQRALRSAQSKPSDRFYVLKFGDEYSAESGGYTMSLRRARWFGSRTEAVGQVCGLERVVEVIEREASNG